MYPEVKKIRTYISYTVHVQLECGDAHHVILINIKTNSSVEKL